MLANDIDDVALLGKMEMLESGLDPRHMLSSTFRVGLRSAAALLGLLVMGTANAQQMFEWEVTQERMTAAQSVQALGSDLFGDNVSLQTGTLSFSVTDVDLPGNGAVPVRFTRTYAMNSTRGVTLNEMLADWSVEVPRISARFAPNWTVVDPEAPGIPVPSNARCSNQWVPFIPTGGAFGPPGTFQLSDFWQGVQVHIPGLGAGELLRTSAGITKPSAAYLWTTDGQIHFKCIPLQGNPGGSGPDAGEGFEAITPDGATYSFNRLAQRPVPGLKEEYYDPVSGVTRDIYGLPVLENTLYATRVEDRFGNWVEYSYSNAWNQPGRLTKILAKDGRQIDIAYANDRILTVTAVSPANSADNRTWTYAYGTHRPWAANAEQRYAAGQQFRLGDQLRDAVALTDLVQRFRLHNAHLLVCRRPRQPRRRAHRHRQASLRCNGKLQARHPHSRQEPGHAQLRQRDWPH